MGEPSLMSSRPSTRMICYMDSRGNPHELTVGAGGVTAIRETEENGEYSVIPWIEVWAGDQLIARFNQHKLEHIFYDMPVEEVQ